MRFGLENYWDVEIPEGWRFSKLPDGPCLAEARDRLAVTFHTIPERDWLAQLEESGATPENRSRLESGWTSLGSGEPKCWKSEIGGMVSKSWRLKGAGFYLSVKFQRERARIDDALVATVEQMVASIRSMPIS